MFVNPFKTHSVDEFPGVHVPLEESVPSGPTPHDRQSNSPAPSEKDSKDDKPERPESDASSGVVNHGMTLAALKAEIEADVAASGTDTPYDRTLSYFKLPAFLAVVKRPTLTKLS